jgi:hypothetical protein
MTDSISRFVITGDGRIIDRLNLCGAAGYWHEGDPKDQRYLREQILRMGLINLLDELMPDRRRDQSPGPELVSDAIFHAILASHLNMSEPSGLYRTRSNNLNKDKISLRDFSSISLYIDDVECLLRNLYGDSDSEALLCILSAVQAIVVQCAQSSGDDLWQEYENAGDFDWSRGIGLPEGYGISGSWHASGSRGLSNLLTRVSEVLTNASAFSTYTFRFAKHCAENFVIPDSVGLVSVRLIVSEPATAPLDWKQRLMADWRNHNG